MSIIGAYRESGVIAATSVSSSAGIVNFTGFKPSGIAHGNALAICNYVWSGTNADGDWVPLRREWCT